MRSLRSVFLAGVVWAVGSTCSGPGPRVLGLGEQCTPNDETAICAGVCVALDDRTGYCTNECTGDEQCPGEQACLPAGRFGTVCQPVGGCSETSDCPAGHTCNPATGQCYIAVSRGLCSPCQDEAQCPEGGTCFTAVGSRERFCTTACADGVCPTGFTCRGVPVGARGELQAQCVPVRETCNAGRVLCDACSGDQQCGGPNDVCVRNVVSGEQFCGIDCDPKKNLCSFPGCDPTTLAAAPNPGCPTGFACTVVREGDGPSVHQCVPASSSCRTYCDPAKDVGQTSSCGLGRVCRAGGCAPASDGRVCAPCTSSDDCRAGGFSENRCVVNDCPNCPFRGESFCAPACSDDAACASALGAGFKCVEVADQGGGRRRFCMPERGSCQGGLRRPGEDCGTGGARDCITGLCVKAGAVSFCTKACAADIECGDGLSRCCEVADGGSYDCSPARRGPTGPLSGRGVCAPQTGIFGDDCSPGQPPCQTGTCLDLGTTRVCSRECGPGAECPERFLCRQARVGAEADAGLVSVCFPNGGGGPGADCSFGPAACASGLCIRKASGPICTAPCMTNADCPEGGWMCDAIDSVTNQSVQACVPPELQP